MTKQRGDFNFGDKVRITSSSESFTGVVTKPKNDRETESLWIQADEGPNLPNWLKGTGPLFGWSGYQIELIEPAPPTVEYVLRFGETEIDVYYNKRDAIIGGSAVRAYFEASMPYPAVYTSKVGIFERPSKPVEKEIDF